jgi:hypothetical protein
MAFDPDEYLRSARPAPATPPTKFDPDAYLSAKPTAFDPDAYLKQQPAPAPAKPPTTGPNPFAAAPPEESGFLRQAADIPIGVTQGIVSGVRMIANAFGADSDTSNLIRGYEDQIGELLSAQAKNDKKEINRILKEAENKGVLDQLVAAGKAFATAPLDLTVQALGTSAPGIVAGLGTTLAGAPTSVALGVSSAVGAVMGAGEVKGNIYDATKEELLKIGTPKDKAEQIASAAQSYGGKNLDQILIASGIGAVTGGTGFESAAIKGLTGRILGKAAAAEAGEVATKGAARRISEGIFKESVPEFLQGSQQQLAENLALQREGFAVPTGRGVVSQGALEALSSMPLGAYAGYRDRGKAAQTKEDQLLADLDAQALSEETTDDFIAAQRAGAGAEPGIDVTGVPRTGIAETTGVSDTEGVGAPPTGGLAGAGAAATVAGEGARVEPGALEEYYPDMDEAPTAAPEAKAPSIKPVFALPEGFAHGTDYLTAQKIIQQGRLIPDAGKRMYSYSQFGRNAVYLTDINGWWLNAEKAADGRAIAYDASVPFKLDPKANIREVNTQAELDAIAREIGEPDANSMMRKLGVENLDYEQAAREIKNLSFEEFVKDAVKKRRERLQRYEAPGADTVKDIASWAAQDAKESPEFARSEEDILDSLRNE